MKKIINSILIIFFMISLTFIPNVYAAGTYCNERSAENCDSSVYGLDPDGNTCKYNGSACATVKYACKEKKHCSCYNYEECPDFDDYGDMCRAMPKSNSCTVRPADTEIDENSYDNYEEKGDITCGNGLTFNKSIANITHFMVLLFQILAPSILIILGMIDFFKAVSSGKDEDLKKAGSTFVKRLITAILMFLIIMIVRIVISLLSNQTIMDCFNCFVNGANKC